jgi:hypothetical protein
VYALLVVVPLVMLAVASLTTIEPTATAGNNLFLYVLLFIAVLELAIIPLVERVQISMRKKVTVTQMAPEQFLFSLLLIRISFVTAIYIYGLVAYLVIGEITNMLYFYAIGIVGSLIYWPTESRQQALLARMERS